MSGASVWVPAGEVFAPYKPPPDVYWPSGWVGTGLASGNTLLEAVSQAIDEVVERDALSKYLDGQPGRLLDLRSVPAGPERDVLTRFDAAAVDVYAIDLSQLAPLPTYCAAVVDRDGLSTLIPVAGQGTNLCATVALRRALLEAAQSRIVAIQGSREDLVRHASAWTEDAAARRSRWKCSRAEAEAGGVATLPTRDRTRASVADRVTRQLRALEAHGYTEVVVVELTDPRVGIPVVRVVIPGMFDGEFDPERRRRRG